MTLKLGPIDPEIDRLERLLAQMPDRPGFWWTVGAKLAQWVRVTGRWALEPVRSIVRTWNSPYASDWWFLTFVWAWAGLMFTDFTLGLNKLPETVAVRLAVLAGFIVSGVRISVLERRRVAEQDLADPDEWETIIDPAPELELSKLEDDTEWTAEVRRAYDPRQSTQLVPVALGPSTGVTGGSVTFRLETMPGPRAGAVYIEQRPTSTGPLPSRRELRGSTGELSVGELRVRWWEGQLRRTASAEVVAGLEGTEWQAEPVYGVTAQAVAARLGLADPGSFTCALVPAGMTAEELLRTVEKWQLLTSEAPSSTLGAAGGASGPADGSEVTETPSEAGRGLHCPQCGTSDPHAWAEARGGPEVWCGRCSFEDRRGPDIVDGCGPTCTHPGVTGVRGCGGFADHAAVPCPNPGCDGRCGA